MFLSKNKLSGWFYYHHPDFVTDSYLLDKPICKRFTCS